MNKKQSLFLSIFSLIGLIPSFIITVEKGRLSADSDYSASCNISPLVSCTNIMESAQASAFGFPNSIMGIIGFTAIFTLGILGLLGSQIPKTVYVLANIGLLFSAAFSLWLWFQATYVLGAICLYCVVVWFASMMLFSHLTWFNILDALKIKMFNFGWLLGLITFLGMITLIISKYWYSLQFIFV
jgi:uncharacterized membrane protein